jgi:hypothetical protein
MAKLPASLTFPIISLGLGLLLNLALGRASPVAHMDKLSDNLCFKFLKQGKR